MSGRARLVRCTTALVVALLVTASTTARAAGPSAADRETARTLMDQGRALRDKGDMGEALKRFRAANDIMHVPTTALEVAKAQVALGLLVEARDTVGVMRALPPQKNESPLFKTARASLEQLDASIAPKVPSLTITLKGVESGQEPELTLDGVTVPAAVVGLPRAVDPGHHTVAAKTATAAGTQDFDIREGEQKPVEVSLEPTTPVAPPVAVVEPPPATPEEAPPPKKSHVPPTLALVGIGVAGAGVIVGTITGVLSLSQKSSLSSQCPNDVCGPGSNLSSAETLATVSDIGFIVAGAGAVVAVVGFVRGNGKPATPPPAASAGFTVAPWLAAGAGGVRGTF